MRLKGYPGDVLLLGLFLLPVLVVIPALLALLVAGMLSARIPGMDPWFGGLVRVWTIHRWLGFSAFMLVMVHVLLLAFATLSFSIGRSIATLFPPLSHSGWPEPGRLQLVNRPWLDLPTTTLDSGVSI